MSSTHSSSSSCKRHQPLASKTCDPSDPKHHSNATAGALLEPSRQPEQDEAP